MALAITAHRHADVFQHSNEKSPTGQVIDRAWKDIRRFVRKDTLGVTMGAGVKLMKTLHEHGPKSIQFKEFAASFEGLARNQKENDEMRMLVDPMLAATHSFIEALAATMTNLSETQYEEQRIVKFTGLTEVPLTQITIDQTTVSTQTESTIETNTPSQLSQASPQKTLRSRNPRVMQRIAREDIVQPQLTLPSRKRTTAAPTAAITAKKAKLAIEGAREFTPTGRPKTPCPFCDKSYAVKRYFDNHLAMKHNGEMPKEEKNEVKEEESSNSSQVAAPEAADSKHEVEEECPICDFIGKGKAFAEHMKMEHNIMFTRASAKTVATKKCGKKE